MITSTCVFSFVYELEMVVSLVSSFPSLCLEFRHFGLYFISRIRIHFSTIVIVHVYLYLSFPLFFYLIWWIIWHWIVDHGKKRWIMGQPLMKLWPIFEMKLISKINLHFKNQFKFLKSIQISKINLKFPKLSWISKINSNFRN